MLPADALEKLRANDESYTKCDLSYSSLFSSRADELAAEIAEALKTNTHCVELKLPGCGISGTGAAALADMLKVNSTITKLDLEKNNIDTAGIQAIGMMLRENKSLVEMNLLNQSLGAPGETALTAFVESFEFNTTLMNIIWRLTSRQSFKINACITRNNEIARRVKAGMSIDDICPNKRREAANKLLAERGPDGTPGKWVAPPSEEITEKIESRGGPYTLKEMTAKRELLPDDVDPDKREDYLSDDDFKKVLNMDRDEFAKSPGWKRRQKKKDAGLW